VPNLRHLALAALLHGVFPVNLRYQYATEMQTDLLRLKRDAESSACGSVGCITTTLSIVFDFDLKGNHQ
jgi:hypothetical protein